MAGHGDMHPRHPPVVGIDLAGDQALLLQAGDDPGHGGGLHPLDARQLTEGQGAEAIEGRQGGDLRGRDVLGLLTQAAREAHHRQAEAGCQLGVLAGGNGSA